jgi:hypothetical protein
MEKLKILAIGFETDCRIKRKTKAQIRIVSIESDIARGRLRLVSQIKGMSMIGSPGDQRRIIQCSVVESSCRNSDHLIAAFSRYPASPCPQPSAISSGEELRGSPIVPIVGCALGEYIDRYKQKAIRPITRQEFNLSLFAKPLKDLAKFEDLSLMMTPLFCDSSTITKKDLQVL